MDTAIKGFIPTTMLDWEGKLAATLFVGGCNFRCPWCQNPDLVLKPEKLANYEWEEIEKHLKEKKEWLDGVVVTGGEPTVHNSLPELLGTIKSLDYPVKLDTNGSRPDMLKTLVEKSLVDYFAMDIKTGFNNYNKACGVSVDIKQIMQSINIILSSSIDHEFRTTVVPGFVDESDILEIANTIKGAKKYTLQQFNPRKTIASEISQTEPYAQEILHNMEAQASKFISCLLRD